MNAEQQISRRPYNEKVELSIVGMGGIVVIGMPQAQADKIVAESIERGVNYFDVSPSYGKGEAEEKLGIALQPYRKEIFLACKTICRDAAGAAEELEGSLKRLRTDYLDLYQFHAIEKMEDVEQILADGGAMDFFQQARQQGKVRHIGFSAHAEQPAVAMLEQFEFDSVLFPVNFVCWRGNFGQRILETAKAKAAARMAIKTLAYTTVPKGQDRPVKKCWYEPVTEPDLVRQALRFALSQDITSALPPGDERLYRICLDAAADFKPLTTAEMDKLLADAEGIKPIFPR